MAGMAQPQIARVRRSAALAALLVILTLVGCEASPAATSPGPSGRATPTPRTTPSGPATPTPWTLILPAPEVPPLELAVEHGGSTVPRRVCIETAIDSIIHYPIDNISKVLGVLGVAVASTECDAVISIEARGHRIAERYWGAGTCYSGWEVSGAISWTVGMANAGTWPLDEYVPPPQAVSECRDARDTIHPPLPSRQLGQMLVDLFGGAGFVAPLLVVPPGDALIDWTDWIDPTWADVPSDGCRAAAARIADALWRSDSADERDWVADWSIWYTRSKCPDRVFDPVVPYLIAALAEDEATSSRGESIRAVLSNLTGQSFDSAQAWWGWWQREGRSPTATG